MQGARHQDLQEQQLPVKLPSEEPEFEDAMEALDLIKPLGQV